MENNIIQFQNIMRETQEKEDAEFARDLAEASVLTEDDMEELKAAEAEVADGAVIVKNHIGGTTQETALDDFLASVDKAVPTMKSDGLKLVSMTQPDKMADVVTGIKGNFEEELRSHALVEISKEEFHNLVQEMLAMLKVQLGTSTLHSEAVTTHFSKMSAADVLNVVPRRFVECFVPTETLKTNRTQAKDIVVSFLEFLVLNGPENDEFSSYLENQNKLLSVLEAINKTNFEVKDMLESRESIADMVSAYMKRADPRTEAYLKYVKSPDNINMIFSQHTEVNKAFAEAYAELKSKYTDPDEIAVVQHEIDDAQAKAELYQSVLKLEVFTEVFNIFTAEYMKDKRRSVSGLEKVAKMNVERIYRAGLDAPFPGFTGTEKSPAQIYANYITHFTKNAVKYNQFVEQANAAETYKLPLIADPRVFANTVLVVMGRLQKRLLKEPATFRDKLEIVVYFELFCRLCTDIFTTAKVVEMTADFVEILLNEN